MKQGCTLTVWEGENFIGSSQNFNSTALDWLDLVSKNWVIYVDLLGTFSISSNFYFIGMERQNFLITLHLLIKVTMLLKWYKDFDLKKFLLHKLSNINYY